MDLMRQIRVEIVGERQNSVELTSEYLVYFEDMVKNRVELAKSIVAQTASAT